MTALKIKSQKTRLRSENPDPVDIYVGIRVRVRRNLLGLSQEQLAQSLGLTFQQIQKYERGINRMGASRLFQISVILAVPVAYFFEGIVEAQNPLLPSAVVGGNAIPFLESAVPLQLTDSDILHRNETLELVRAYYHIKDTKQRRKIYELIRSMAEEKLLPSD